MTSMGCDAGDTVCSGICTDLDTDSNNCGKCGNVCTGVCSMGNCCALGEQYCSGACIDTTSDDDNCGMCGMKCTGTDGTCCSSECTNTATDMNNCGMCGMSCSGGTCSASTCIVPCAIPQGSCTHSLCATGGPLTEGCDGDEECTILLCDTESSFGFDPSCCTTAWTSECVSEVESFYVSSFGGCL